MKTGKEEFTDPALISAVFHELRTPLSSINGYASILLTFELGRLNKRQSDVVNKIRQLCDYLTSLINNLLQISKLDMASSSPAKKSKVYLNELAQAAAQTLSPAAKAKKIKVSVSAHKTLPHVWGNEDELSGVFINLLSNAIKFTPKAGRVNIRLSYIKTKGKKEALINVSDTGVGIAPESMPKIFHEFYHEDRPEVGAVGGTGLGLCIVKKVIESHDGKVWLKSRPGEGTTVSFALPVSPRLKKRR